MFWIKWSEIKKIVARTKILLLIIFAISIPIIVAALLEFSLFWKVETDNDWIGFYASYIGSIIGIIGVFMVMHIDQLKRDEERKDELFLNNLLIYRKIASSINVKELSGFRGGMDEIKNEVGWSMVDSVTKKKLRHIENNVYYSDELNGLHYAIRCFLRSNLYEELKVELSNVGDEYNQPFEYEDVPDVVLDELTNIIINNLDRDMLRENNIQIEGSKSELKKRMENGSYTKGYGDKIDAIHAKLGRMNESKDWLNYISKRERIFREISSIVNYINKRIEQVLTY